MSPVARLLAMGAGAGRQTLSRVLPAGKERILAELEKNAPEMMRRAAQKDTGFTFDPRRGKFLEAGEQAGSMMATVPNLPGQTSGLGTARNLDELLATLRKPETVERFRRGEYVGAWNPAGEGVGLDPSRRHLTRLGALLSGSKTGQIGGFDLARQIGYDVTPEATRAAAATLAAKTGAVVGTGALAGATLPQSEQVQQAREAFDRFLTGLRGTSEQGQGVAQSLGGTLRNLGSDPLLLAGALVPGGKLFKTGGKAAKMMPSVDEALSGVTKAVSGKASKKSIEDLLAATRESSGAGSSNPSEYANSIVKQLKAQTKTTKKTVKKKGGEVEVDVPVLTFGPGGGKYPDELKQLGLQPIQGYNYAVGKTADILKLDEPTVLAVLKSNIRALSGKGGASGFYTDVNQALRSSTGNTLPSEQLGGGFAPFSMSTAVPQNAVQARRFFENPELFPGRIPGEGTLAAGNAWKQGLRSAVNENPLDPRNFNAAGRVIKVGSFAENTGLPLTSMRATIDRHAVQAALGIRPAADDIIPDLQNEKVYRLFERAYQEVANELGVLPSQLQSEVWDVWRRIMVKNPGASSPTGFFLPTTPSDIWKLSPTKRKKKLRDLFSAEGRDETFLGEAGLL